MYKICKKITKFRFVQNLQKIYKTQICTKSTNNAQNFDLYQIYEKCTKFKFLQNLQKIYKIYIFTKSTNFFRKCRYFFTLQNLVSTKSTKLLTKFRYHFYDAKFRFLQQKCNQVRSAINQRVFTQQTGDVCLESPFHLPGNAQP